MKVKFNNGDFDFYRSGVMVLERLKKGISSRVRAFKHELFNLSFPNFNMLLLMTKIEVKFNNDDFDFYRSGVMVLERLKKGVSCRVRAFTHELFFLSFPNFNMLLLMTKWRSKFNNGDFDFYRSGVMVLERLKNGVSSRVRAFSHELFNQSFPNFNMLLLMTKWRISHH